MCTHINTHTHTHTHYISSSMCSPSTNSQASFLEKNNDALHASLEQLIAVSKDPFIKKLFPEAMKSNDGVNTKKLVLISVGSKFRVSDRPAWSMC